ncbi:MAG: class IV adenylate cyclase [Bryobacteraceae bacterium]|jgi:adenylate cyclase class 2
MTHNGREVEIKLAVSGAVEARRMLRAAGFRVYERRVFEKNTVFDTSSQTLRNSARLLRVREIGKIAKLTYKGPPDNGKYKSREELELDVSDARTIGAIFERLAYHPAFRYDKFRTEFRQRGASGVVTDGSVTGGVAMVDETPIGVYLELEGSPAWIDRTARKLGFAEKDYITASYARLYTEWCEARGVEPTNMLFA